LVEIHIFNSFCVSFHSLVSEFVVFSEFQIILGEGNFWHFWLVFQDGAFCSGMGL
jgi:hypothetical protein